MRKVCFVLGTFEARAVDAGEALTDWTFDQLDGIALRRDLDASIVFVVQDPRLASLPKNELGIERIREERPRVLAEIAATGADLVVCFGPIAAACVFDRGNLTEAVLQRRAHRPLGDVPVVYYTSSIEAVRQSPGLVNWWDLDIAAALDGYNEPQIGDWELNPAVDGVHLGPMMPTIGFDLETTGLNPWSPNAQIRMCVLCWRDVRGPMVTFVYDWPPPNWVLRVLADFAYQKTGSNIAFDVRWCARFGVEVNNYLDVVTAEHVLFPGNPRLSLKDLGFKYFPQVANYHHAVQELAKAANDDWSKIPAAAMYPYCAADGQVSLVAAERQVALTETAQSGLNNARGLLAAVYPIFTGITINGARIDPAANVDLDALYREKMSDLRGQITQVLGPINPNSPDQLAGALRREVPGINLSPRKLRRVLSNDEDSPGEDDLSTDRRVLEREAHRHPVVSTILEYRKYRVRHSTFIEGLRTKHAVEHHGALWVHPDFRTDVTDTYRSSSRSPNGQNLPRNETDARYSVKRQFVSRFPGGKILEMDLSQIELRVAAWFSGDEAMLRAFEGGLDVHREMASMVLGKPAGDISDEERQNMKTVNFGVVYGIGAKKLAEELSVPMHEASRLIRAYFEQYPRLHRTIGEIHAVVERECAVTTPFGFRRLFFAPVHWNNKDGHRIKRQAWNTIIQNVAACLMYCVMVRYDELVREQGLRVRAVPILQVHDSLVFDVPGDGVEILAQLLQRAVSEARDVARRYGVEFTVPIEAEIKAGPNWGEMEKL